MVRIRKPGYGERPGYILDIRLYHGIEISRTDLVSRDLWISQAFQWVDQLLSPRSE